MAITFTEDDVVAAYRRHPEYRPCFRSFAALRKDGNPGCCPLAILCVIPGVPLDAPTRKRFLVPSETLGVTDAESRGFSAAVDRKPPPLGDESWPGYGLGRRVLRRLADEGMLSPKLTTKVLSLPEEER